MSLYDKLLGEGIEQWGVRLSVRRYWLDVSRRVLGVSGYITLTFRARRMPPRTDQSILALELQVRLLPQFLDHPDGQP